MPHLDAVGERRGNPVLVMAARAVVKVDAALESGLLGMKLRWTVASLPGIVSAQPTPGMICMSATPDHVMGGRRPCMHSEDSHGFTVPQMPSSTELMSWLEVNAVTACASSSAGISPE